MKITILAIGKFENSCHKEVFYNYLKRSKFKIELKEIDNRNNGNFKGEKLKEMEAELFIKNFKKNSIIISLDEKANQLSTIEFAAKINEFAINGNSDLTFLIGGSDGLAKKILDLSDLKISLSKMTFPHLMVRSILMEQIYRAETIINNHPYHRS
jgi:23S rRNA (pseudouridine1915-N3)-methyltransferase